MEILELFATESLAVAWFERVRWQGVPTCSHCSNTEHLSQPKSKPFTYWCKACRQTFTVRTGTVMESSRLPLQKWAVAAYYILTARKGISSVQLSKELKITQKTAWFLLQRIREACRHDQFKLDLIVEIDEVYIGGKNRNRHAWKRPKIGQGTSWETGRLRHAAAARADQGDSRQQNGSGYLASAHYEACGSWGDHLHGRCWNVQGFERVGLYASCGGPIQLENT